MKRFLKNTIIFTAVILCVFLSIQYLFRLSQKWTCKLPEDVTAVFLGTSTIRYGVVDSLIPGSVTWGDDAEPIEVVYYKLKILKKNNPQLQTAFVELDNVILTNKVLHADKTHPYYLSEQSPADIINNLRNQSFQRNTSYLSHVFDCIKINRLLRAFKSGQIQDLGIGEYTDLFREFNADVIAKQKIETINNNAKGIIIPSSSIYYYKAIHKFCDENNIRLIFIATPRHKEFETHPEYLKFHCENFPDVPLLDYTTFSLPDSCWSDILHVNYRGARQFSDSLNKDIRKNKYIR